MILTAGKVPLAQYIGRDRDSFGDRIVVGAGEAAVTATDSALTYKTGSAIITDLSYRQVSGNNYLLIIVSDLPSEFVGTVYEVGIVGSTLENLELATSTQSLLSFSDVGESWDVGTHVDSRIEGRGLQLSPAGSPVVANLTSPSYTFDNYDISKDVFKLAFEVTSGTISTVSVTFVTPGGNKTISATPTSGYEVHSELMSASLAAVSDLDVINSIQISADGTGDVTFDGFMADIVDTSRVTETLYMRHVLASPFTKAVGTESGVEVQIPVVLS